MNSATDTGDERDGLLGALVGLVDRAVPEELQARNESRLRARVLVVSSVSIGALVLVGQTIRALTLPIDGNFWAGIAIIGVLLVLPLIQLVTRSVRLAGGLLSLILIAALPAILANFGRFPAPVLAFYPVVPVLVTFFSGATFGLVGTLVLSTSVVVLAGRLPIVSEAFAPQMPTVIAFTAISPIICFLLAAVYDRNRQRNEADLERRGRELVAARFEAEEADRRKTEFLRHMSHELRTPLNAIIGYGELLVEELADDPELAGDAQKIGAASRHLLGLINDLLDISKIEAGALALEYERFALCDLFTEIGDTLRPLAGQRDNTLEVACDPAIGEIECDRQRLHQILLNLGGNACKFSEGGRIEIRASVSEGGARVRFEVADQGVGMDPGDLARIFEPFVQVDESASRRRAGSGLGLMITKKLIEHLGGAIRVTSARGVGSTFTFDLPTRRPEHLRRSSSGARSA